MKTRFLSKIEWREIPGYEGLYEASNTGLVRTVAGKTTYTKRHGERVWAQRELKPHVQNNRESVSLWKDGKSKTKLVHRLVALSFLPNPDNLPCINHINGNTRNNDVGNLEWCTHEHNNNHALDSGLNKMSTVVRLTHKETQGTFIFRSMTKASEFIGKHRNFVSALLKKGENEADGYIIEKVSS